MDDARNARALRSRNLEAGGAPAPPILTLVVQSYNSVKITWPADSTAAHFVVERSTDGGVTYSTLAAAVLNTFYEDDAVSANTLYVYRVQGIGMLGEGSELSPALAVWTKPAAVTNLVGSVNVSHQVSLSWTPVDGPGQVTYRVARVGGIESRPTPLPAYGEFVTPGQVYSYLVWANGPGGDGPASFVSFGDGVSAPTNLTLGTITSTTVALTWTGDTGAGISYEVRSSLNGTDYTVAATSSTTSVTVTGLATGTAYSFRVYRLQGGIYLGPSNTVTATTLSTPPAPATPEGLYVTSYTASFVTLAWTASAGATSYNVYRGNLPLEAGVTEAAYEDDTVTPNAYFSYYVTAVNGGGESGPSNEADVTTVSADAQNLQPAGLNWLSADSAALVWDAPSDGTTEWVVSVSTDGGVTFGPVADPNTNSVTLTGLTPDTAYAFMVQAVNSEDIESPAGTAPVISGTTWPTPGQPTLSADATDITIAWTGSASGYDVTVGSSPEGGSTVANNVTSPYTVTGLNPSTTYYFVVNNAGQNDGANTSGWSDRFDTLLLPPTVTEVDSTSSTNLTVFWTPDSGTPPSGYNLYMDDSVRVSNMVGGPYEDGGLSPNSTHAYSVTSLDGFGRESAPSNVVGATTLSADVTGLTVAAVPSWSEVDLTWDGPSDGTSQWNVYVSTDGNNWSPASGTVGTGTASVTGLDPNTLYHFQVRAVNSSEQESPEGSAPTVTATTHIAAPTSVSANTVSATEIDLSWSGAEGISNCDVYASTDDGVSYVLLASNLLNPANATGLTANTGYKFLVVNAGDPVTNNSGAVQVTTWPSDPTNLAVVSNNPAELDLSWDTDGRCTNFEVQVQPSGAGWGSPFIDDASPGNTANSAVYTSSNGLESGTTYDVRIRSVNNMYYTTGNWVEMDGVSTE